MDDDRVIAAEVHLTHLRSWNQPRWDEDGRQLGFQHTGEIKIIEDLLEYARELKARITE